MNKKTNKKTIAQKKKVMPKAEDSVKVDPFKKILHIFENNIFLHEVSIKEIGTHAREYDKTTLKEIEWIFNSKTKKIKSKLKITLSDEEVKTILDSLLKKRPQQSILFCKNTVVSLVSTLDVLFSKLFEFYYKKFPEKLSLENQSIRFKELKNISNIEDAQRLLISREIESLLFQQGLSERLNVLNKQIGIEITTIEKQILDLKKLIKIRNLIVHSEGRIDQDYINKYGDKELKINSPIKLNHEYLIDSLYLVYFVGTYILQEAQLKLSDKIKSDDFLLNNALHTLIKNNQFNYIKSIYHFAQNHKMDDINKKLIVINYCIGLKKQGKDIEHIKKVLELEDWTMEKAEFEMSKNALLGDTKNFYIQLEKLIKNKTIEKNELSEWTIFDFYRNESKFKTLIKTIIK